MVRDIMLDMKECDLLMTDKSSLNVPVFDAIWGNLFDEDSHVDILICNIIVPEAYWGMMEYTDNELICYVNVPYHPNTSNFNIRWIALKNGAYSLFFNIRGDFGIPVNSYALNKNIATPISASMLPYIDIDGRFLIKAIQHPKLAILDRVYIYSAKSTDISIDFSDSQASQLLSLCAPGNSYRYPTTGVGITKYLNTVIEHTDLREVLENQFAKDGKPIQNADFDNESGVFDVLCNPEAVVSDTNIESIENLNSEFFDLFSDEYVRRNIVLDQKSDEDFIAALNDYDNVLDILLFKDFDSKVTRIVNQVCDGKFDAEGNIVEDDEHVVVYATLNAGSIIMFDVEADDVAENVPIFIVNDQDETRLYTSLIGQPYWVVEDCHKCFVLNKRVTVKYTLNRTSFQAGKGLCVVDRDSNNLKNLLALVQDSCTGRLLGIVSNSTNIRDIILDQVTQHIYALQSK